MVFIAKALFKSEQLRTRYPNIENTLFFNVFHVFVDILIVCQIIHLNLDGTRWIGEFDKFYLKVILIFFSNVPLPTFPHTKHH